MNMRQSLGRAGALLAVLAAALAVVSGAGADAIGPMTFESSQGYHVGDINGQPGNGTLPNGDWSKTNPLYDVNVVPVSAYSAASGYGFGSQTLEISDAYTQQSFGDQTFSPGLADEAGETSAVNLGLSGGIRQPHFDASFLIGSSQGTYVPGLHMSVSPDRGDGARMSYLRFEDQTDGIHVFFEDVVDPGRVANGDSFRETDIATLDRAYSHLIQFSIDLKDGPANDTVKIYIDNVLKITGGTWEDYYRYDSEQAAQDNQVPTIDKLLFRESGTAHPSNATKGFLIDRVTLGSSGARTRK
jgi:hypothetical protein